MNDAIRLRLANVRERDTALHALLELTAVLGGSFTMEAMACVWPLAVGAEHADGLEAAVGPSMPALNTKGYSSTYLAMGFANVRAGTQKRRGVFEYPPEH